MRDSRRTSKTFNRTVHQSGGKRAKCQAVGASPWPSRVNGRLVSRRCISQANSLTQNSDRYRDLGSGSPLPPALSSRRELHGWPPTAFNQTRTAVSTTGKCNNTRRTRVRLTEGKGQGREGRGSMREGTLSRGNVLLIVLTSLPHKVDNILAGS